MDPRLYGPQRYDPEAVAAYAQLAGLLVVEPASLVAEIEYAHRDPDAYRQWLGAAWLRGSSAPYPWLAFVDGLVRRRVVAESGWRDSTEEWVYRLNQLASLDAARIVLTEEEFSAVEGPAIFAELADRLVASGLELVHFDFFSDDAALAALSPPVAAEVRRLAASIGEDIVDARALSASTESTDATDAAPIPDPPAVRPPSLIPPAQPLTPDVGPPKRRKWPFGRTERG